EHVALAEPAQRPGRVERRVHVRPGDVPAGRPARHFAAEPRVTVGDLGGALHTPRTPGRVSEARRPRRLGGEVGGGYEGAVDAVAQLARIDAAVDRLAGQVDAVAELD